MPTPAAVGLVPLQRMLRVLRSIVLAKLTVVRVKKVVAVRVTVFSGEDGGAGGKTGAGVGGEAGEDDGRVVGTEAGDLDGVGDHCLVGGDVEILAGADRIRKLGRTFYEKLEVKTLNARPFSSIRNLTERFLPRREA